MFLKVSECFFCGKYYRTGLIRQIKNKEIAYSVRKDDKKSFTESIILTCIGCLKRIENKEGVECKARDSGFADGLLDFDDNLAQIGKSLDGAGRKEVKKEIEKPKKERKSRKIKWDNDPMAQALSEGGLEDEDTEPPVEPKKRGRKPKPKVMPTEPVEPKKRGRKPKAHGVDAETLASELSKGIKDMTATSEPVVEQPKPELEVPAEDTSNPTEGTITKADPIRIPSTTKPKFVARSDGSMVDREVLKRSVQEGLQSKPNILYSEIAEKLGLSEELVGELVDEIDVGA
jgi:hypothetical protein